MTWAGEYGLYSSDMTIEQVERAEEIARKRMQDEGWKNLRKDQRERIYKAAVIHYIQSGDLEIEDEDLYPLEGYGKHGKHAFSQFARSYINKLAPSIKGIGDRLASGGMGHLNPQDSIDIEFYNQENWQFSHESDPRYHQRTRPREIPLEIEEDLDDYFDDDPEDDANENN